MPDYDIITIGGGLAGASLARSMATGGARVLVLERETKFKDRVRGEGMTTWGAAEARELGIYDVLLGACGHPVPRWQNFIGPMQVLDRNVVETTPQQLPTLAFYHPAMQSALIEAAGAAGAEVRTGVRATNVTPGATPTVTVQRDGAAAETISARLVVGGDGRNSPVRKWGGFSETQDPQRLYVTGALFDDSPAPDDAVRFSNEFQRGSATIIFPQGNGRVRTYLISRVADGNRLQGEKDIPAYVESSVQAGMPREYLTTLAGPLATFEGADCFVEHPYRDGVALIGDAAASSDPSWGQGLSLTLRDARVLRDALTSNGDWDAAGHAYATEHDRYFGVVHTIEDWLTQLFYDVGPDADARRGKVMAEAAQDPTVLPDTFWSGPDHPVNDAMRKRLFATD